MELNKNILVITGCVTVKCHYSKLSNSQERLNQYIETIRWAVEESDFDIIIFCENSNCKYDFNKFVNKINKSNKVFEYLTFNDENDFSKYAIGFGEIQILKYAYNNSKYLKNSDSFWKITGRLKIKNINEIIAKSRKRNIVFLNYYKWFDTRLYKMPTKIFKDYFMNISFTEFGQFNDDFSKPIIRTCLEKIYYKIYKNNRLDRSVSKNKNFPSYPIWIGVSGSLGTSYSMSKSKIILNNLLCKLNIFNNQIIQHLYVLLFQKR